MYANLKVFHRGLILVGVPLICGILILTFLYLVVLQTDREVAQGQGYKKAEEHVSTLIVTVYHLGYTLTTKLKQGMFADIGSLTDDLRTIVQLRKELSEQFKDYEQPEFIQSQEALNDGLRTLGRLGTNFLRPANLKSLMDNNSYSTDRKEVGVKLDKAYNALQILLSLSEKEMVETNMRQQELLLNLQAFILFSGLAVSIALALILAKFFMRGIVRRLEVITDNTVRLETGQELHARLTGSDEIADVDRAFHEMAFALAQTAERERALFDNASDVICVLDSSGRFTRVNPASLRVWGRKPEELVGTPLISLVEAEDRGSVASAIARSQGDSPALEFECRLQTDGATPMETLWSVYWAESEESLFCVAHDISERKKLERMKQEFLAMVSHDLRSPLTSITGVFELLGRGKYGELPAGAVDKVGMARRNVARLLSMVNDLLDMEKLEAGQLELTFEKTDIAELLERCLQEVEAIAEQKKVKLSLESCEGEVQLDGDRIIQVIVNLLSNAIKFSPDGGVVTLSAQIHEDRIEILVKDQGRGVPAHACETIFERFKQVEAADGKRKAGTGLGLPICKQLVELHGGRIGVDSEEGAGSTFWMRLPLAPQAVQRQDPELTARLDGAAKRKESQRQTKREVESVDNDPQRARKSLRRDLSMIQKGILLVGVPLLFELVLVAALGSVLMEVNQMKAHERYLHEVSYSATRMVAGFMKAGRAVSGAQGSTAWQAFIEASDDLRSAYNRLQELTSREPALAQEFIAIKSMAEPGLAYIARARQEMEGHQITVENVLLAFRDREEMEPIIDKLGQNLIGLMSRLDQMPSVSAAKQESLHRQQGTLLLAGVGANIFISLLLVVFFSRGITSRLSVLRENAMLLATEKELRPEIAGSDEIARLDKVFHHMAKALTEAQIKERAVFDNSQDLICAVDLQGVFRQINSACERMWGYRPEQLLNSSVCGLLVAEDHERLFDQLQKAPSRGAVFEFENHVVATDGTVKEVLWSANWSADRQLLFCVAHDITKRKELERLKHDFLAMVSHDLRTPLTAVNGVAKLMLAQAFGPMPELAAQKLQIVVNNVNRLLNLINDLLDMEKLDAGQMQLSIEPTSVRSILDRSAQALEGMARDKGVELAVDPVEGEINADGDRLIQALVNLLSNAIKFSPAGGKVTLTAEYDSGICELKVIDQGRGVPEEYRQTIFERFKQVEAADGKRSKGTGLGLPISKKIVEGHGGTIGVDSVMGEGSTFWVRLPCETGGGREAMRGIAPTGAESS